MSLLKSNSVQIGQSVTATNNFTLSVPSSPDGTIKLARGNSGATTQDILTVNSSGEVALTNGGAITLATAQTPTSGTAVDFTSIPSWAKRVTVMLNGVSLSGTSAFLFQVGSGSFATTGYNSGAASVSVNVINTTNGAGANTTNGISSGGYTGTAASTAYGHVIFTKITGNTWVASGVLYVNDALRVATFGGGVNLSGVLDRVRITTVNGTDTFDDGTINIMYEG